MTTKAPSAPLPASLMAGLRILLAALGPIAVSRGWLGESDLPNAAALITSAAAFAYGVWKTHDRQVRLNDSEPTLR